MKRPHFDAGEAWAGTTKEKRRAFIASGLAQEARALLL